jgi:hypothetical protein
MSSAHKLGRLVEVRDHYRGHEFLRRIDAGSLGTKRKTLSSLIFFLTKKVKPTIYCGNVVLRPQIVVLHTDSKNFSKGEGKYGSEEGKEKEEIRNESVLGFPPFPRPAPPSGPFCFQPRARRGRPRKPQIIMPGLKGTIGFVRGHGAQAKAQTECALQCQAVDSCYWANIIRLALFPALARATEFSPRHEPWGRAAACITLPCSPASV